MGSVSASVFSVADLQNGGGTGAGVILNGSRTQLGVVFTWSRMGQDDFPQVEWDGIETALLRHP